MSSIYHGMGFFTILPYLCTSSHPIIKQRYGITKQRGKKMTDYATFIIPIEAYENDHDLPAAPKKAEPVVKRKEFGSAVLISDDKKTVVKVRGRDGKEYTKFSVDANNDQDLIDFIFDTYQNLRIGNDMFTKDSWGGVEKNNKFWLSKREVQECQQLFK